MRIGIDFDNTIADYDHVFRLGGLGSAVTDALVEGGGTLPPIARLGIPDSFAHHYGSQDDLMAIYGLRPPQIAEKVRSALRAAAA
jgi:transketolase